MKLSQYGAIQIAITPLKDNPELMTVTIAAQNRKESVTNETRKDETVEQFTGRLRSMLRGLANTEPRNPPVTPQQQQSDPKPATTWEQDRAALTGQKK